MERRRQIYLSRPYRGFHPAAASNEMDTLARLINECTKHLHEIGRAHV